MIDTVFVLDAPNASSVCVCGVFNDWEPGTADLIRQTGGRWEVKLALAPGKYEYKFVVDGEWIADPKARASVSNEHGSQNSVVEVKA